ncbi:hypothetical protein [Prevotella veroralis]
MSLEQYVLSHFVFKPCCEADRRGRLSLLCGIIWEVDEFFKKLI